MNYDMNMIKYRKSGFFRIAAAILMICFTLFGLTACAGTTDSMAMIEIHFKYDITDNCQKFLQVVQDQLGRIGIKIKAQIS